MGKMFYYMEMCMAEKAGKYMYASQCKKKYRELVMAEIIKPHHFYIDKLKMFPTIILN